MKDVFLLSWKYLWSNLLRVYIRKALLNLLRQSQETYILIEELCGFFLGLRKKLESVSKKSALKEIRPWINCIINHVYYCASTTPDGDPDIIEAKWRMFLCMHKIFMESALMNRWRGRRNIVFGFLKVLVKNSCFFSFEL